MKEFSHMCKFSKVWSINFIPSPSCVCTIIWTQCSLWLERRKCHWFKYHYRLCLLIPFCTESFWWIMGKVWTCAGFSAINADFIMGLQQGAELWPGFQSNGHRQSRRPLAAMAIWIISIKLKQYILNVAETPHLHVNFMDVVAKKKSFFVSVVFPPEAWQRLF